MNLSDLLDFLWSRVSDRALVVVSMLLTFGAMLLVAIGQVSGSSWALTGAAGLELACVLVLALLFGRLP